MKFLWLRKFEGLPFLISNQIQNQISKSYRLKKSKITVKSSSFCPRMSQKFQKTEVLVRHRPRCRPRFRPRLQGPIPFHPDQ